MQGGFTLIELMIVTTILGVLAAIATPAYVRYVRRSRTVEAVSGVGRLYRNQISYYQVSAERQSVAEFLSAEPTPASPPSAGRYAANAALWTTGNWAQLDFMMDVSHFYQYSTVGGSESMTATAEGDLDGDGVRSNFSRTVTRMGTDLQGSSLQIMNEIE